jgi:DDE_Tnp_1-associated/Transposase DDE domain
MARPATLLEALALVPDPRSRKGRIHPLVAVLGLAVVATLAGCNSLDAIAQFGRLHGLPLAHALGFRRAKTPNKSALGKIFCRLDIAALERALRIWLEGRGVLAGEHMALDGKTLVGSKDTGLSGRHLLAAYITTHAAVIGQLEVARTTNEHKAALELLGVLPLAGKIVTADAMFTHTDVCDTITDAGGDYILAVKDNQETLAADIATVFEGDGTAFSPLPAAALA